MKNAITYTNTHFFFTISQYINVSFNVLKINGDEGLSCDYKFVIKVICNCPIDNLQLIGNNATLSWNRDSQLEIRHGIISHIISEGLNNEIYLYTFTLHSPLYSLRLTCHNKMYRNQDIVNIICDILQSNKWSNHTYRFSLNKPAQTIEFVTHFNESDFDFIQRLLIRNNLVYYFEQLQNYTILIITDNATEPSNTDELNLFFQRQTTLNSNSTSIYSLHSEATLLSDQFKLNDYNYLRPDMKLNISSQNVTNTQGFGNISLNDLNYLNSDGGNTIGTSLQQQLDSKRIYTIAKSNYLNLIPGQTIKICVPTKHNDQTRFKIISITHETEQNYIHLSDHFNNNIAYQNTLKLIELTSSPYQCTTPLILPKFQGVMFGKIIADDFRDDAAIDEYGRYIVFLPFTDNKYLITVPLRLLQSYGGNHPNNERYGWHYPLNVGTIVILSFINGNINDPIILGVIPNTFMTSPVNVNNHTQNKITTRGSHQILFEEKHGLQKMVFQNPQQTNYLALDDTVNQHKIELISQQGYINLYAQDNMNLRSHDSIKSHSQNNHQIMITNSQQLSTLQKSIQLQSGNDLKLIAQNNIDVSTNNGKITFHSNQNIFAQAQGAYTLQSSHGHTNFYVNNGNIYCSGRKDITLQCMNDGNIIFNKNNNLIKLANNGYALMQSEKIYINSPKICLGNNVLVNNQPLTIP